MSPFEKLEGQVAAMGLRLIKLERQLERLQATSADDLEAQRLAQARRIDVEILRVSGGNAQKRELARELRSKGWSADRIGRVLRVTGRTVERWSRVEGRGSRGNLPRGNAAGAAKEKHD